MWTAKKHFNHEIYTVFMYLHILTFCSDIHNTLKCSRMFVCFKNLSSHFRTKIIRCFDSILLKGFSRFVCNFEFSRWQLINIHEKKTGPEKKVWIIQVFIWRHGGCVGVPLNEFWLFLLFGTPTWPLCRLSFVSLGIVWKPRIE